jgi:hypothetical protein
VAVVLGGGWSVEAQGPGTSSRGAPGVLVVGSSSLEPACPFPPEQIFEPGLRKGLGAVGSPCVLRTTLTLPEHAVVTAVEADVCDSSTIGDVRVSLVRVLRLATSETVLADAETSGSLGCVTLVLTPDPAVSSEGVYLAITVLLGASTSPEQVTVQGLRVLHSGP